jgi:hypothetical protein
MRGKYLNVSGEYAERIYAYMEKMQKAKKPSHATVPLKGLKQEIFVAKFFCAIQPCMAR